MVDEFLEAQLGLKFSRTFLYPSGRDVFAAIFLVICDMLAARQITGFPGATSRDFCMTCGLSIQRIHDLDSDNWPLRDWEHLKSRAQQWEGAASTAERTKIFNETQIRFSPLNRLSYWNAVEFTLADAMHFDLLNNMQHFLRHVLGIDHTVEGGDGSTADIIMQRPPEAALQAAVKKLNDAGSSELFSVTAKALSTSTLRAICFDNRLPFAGAKAALVDELCRWVTCSSNTGSRSNLTS